MKASLYNYKQSPRKVRLLADLVRGKRVSAALTELTFLPKRSALPVKKLIASALANAVNAGVADTENLYVKDIRVDKGIVMQRRMPRARGSAFPIKKRTSHLIVELGQKGEKHSTFKDKITTSKKSAPSKEAVKKEAPKKVVKAKKLPAKAKTPKPKA